MSISATAFAPGHITGFFQILDDAADPAQIGSRGAGFSVALGVESRVTVLDEGVPGVVVRRGGVPIEATTTRRALELLLGADPRPVEVDQSYMLPESQGFGVSAAGALSASMALAEALRRPRREALWAAHCAEVFQRTGLGDVVGAAAGGFEVRVRPGLEPYGRVETWRPQGPSGDVLLAVVAEPILTKRILTDPQRRRDVNEIGGRLVDSFLEDPTLSGFVEASRRFAVEARLAPEPVLRLFDALGPEAGIGQCMLGGSVFAFGASNEARRRLEAAGPVVTTTIDWDGARVTKPRRDG